MTYSEHYFDLIAFCGLSTQDVFLCEFELLGSKLFWHLAVSRVWLLWRFTWVFGVFSNFVGRFWPFFLRFGLNTLRALATLLLDANILADNAARQWLLITASHVVLYYVKRSISKKKHCCTNEAQFLWLLPRHRAFCLWCRKGKKFVNMHLHCVVSNP